MVISCQYFILFVVNVISASPSLLYKDNEQTNQMVDFIEGRPHILVFVSVYEPSYRKEGNESETEWECYEKECNEEANCAVVFNTDNYFCSRLKLSGQVIFWARDRLIRKHRCEEWVTIVPLSSQRLSRPDGLWLFDFFTAGKNLGSSGDALDACIVLSQSRFASSGYFRMSCFLEVTNKSPPLAVYQDIPPEIDFTTGLTYAAWIKYVHRGDRNQLLFDFTTDLLELWITNEGRRLTAYYLGVSGNKTIRKNVSSADMSGAVTEWRHFAVTMDISGALTFYMNGKFISKDYQEQAVRYPPRRFTFFREYEEFFGTMACVAVYSRVLCENELSALMQQCP